MDDKRREFIEAHDGETLKEVYDDVKKQDPELASAIAIVLYERGEWQASEALWQDVVRSRTITADMITAGTLTADTITDGTLTADTITTPRRNYNG